MHPIFHNIMKKSFAFLSVFVLLVLLSSFAERITETLYVVQVKTHTNQKVIESAKNSLMKKYPEKKFLTQFKSPNFTLSVGYFNTQEEAEQFKKEIEADFPGSTVLPFEKKN